MKTYLVGGAVRDKLLCYPITERDWVIVGSTPQHLLQQGYKQVGLDFPVFLHPKTHEEYALARTERKQGTGYTGFTCDANASVTLEEDLARRDLTINAMAMDHNGVLIDPYNGARDLTNKCLRHVSSAFIEDPVRVLRIARFHARYHHLGFYVAAETLALMQQMVLNGELNYLVPERVWKEWRLSLGEKNPECFIETLRDCGAWNCILPEVVLSPNSVEVLQQSMHRSNDPVVRFAALLYSCDNLDVLCKRLNIPTEYRELAHKVFTLHVEVSSIHDLSAEQKLTLLESADAFRRPQMFEKLLLVCEAVRGADAINDQITTSWRAAYVACQRIHAAPFIQQGIQGATIKQCIRNARAEILRNEHEK